MKAVLMILPLSAAGPPRVPSLTGLSNGNLGQAPSAAAPPAPANVPSFSFPTNAQSVQLQGHQPNAAVAPPATAAASSGLLTPASAPLGAAPLPGGANLQLSAPAITAGINLRAGRLCISKLFLQMQLFTCNQSY